MSVSVIAYNNLKVSPYQLTNLTELKIVKKINEHGKLFLKGIVLESLKDSYIDMTKSKTSIEVAHIDKKSRSKPLFKGIVISIKMKSIRGVYYIELEALSHSFDLDIKLKSRSFQNKDMTYKALIQEVISEYSGADNIDTASNGKNIQAFTLQYNETDWQFLKRMVSRFNEGLIPDCTSDKPKFWFGTPKGIGKSKLEDFNYSVSKRIADFRVSSENFNEGIRENDFIYYEVESNKLLNIGYEVEFKGRSFFVHEVNTFMENSIVKHRYTLAPEKGLSKDTLYNNEIIGLSLQGKVIEVAKDDVKVHLEIDEKQNAGEAWWFKYSSIYSAEGNTGWYCMPEIGDSVMVHFPDNKEENALSISSIRKSNEDSKLSSPDVKYFRTKSGKELKFSQDEILITAKDGEVYIKLNEQSGIEIFSKSGVKIISQKDISLDSAQKVMISSKEEINITCKESSINMKDNISINGKQVKVN